MSYEDADLGDTRTGEMELEVIERVRESRHVVSLRLRPTAISAYTPFEAGQHLVLRLGLSQRPLATYTVSSPAHDGSGYRISVKLEPGGHGGSRYVHEEAQVGTRLRALGPRGAFVLVRDDRPVILLTGGIGITPAIAMLHDLARGPARPTYADDWGSDRVFIIDPAVTVFEGGANVVWPASGFVGGLIARVDRGEGYHVSPSNHEIYGITGTARPITFFQGDPNTEQNLLNEVRIATIIRESGFRLWGNETPSTEPLNKFLSVRRTHDVVADSIQSAHLWAMDRPFSLQLLVDIAETVNGFLRQMRNRGVLLGGKVWLDPAKNTATTWVAGQLYVDYDAEAPAPMQRLTFQFNRNTGYYNELAAAAAAEIARLSA